MAGEEATRKEWESRENSADFFAIVDKCMNIPSLNGKPLTYYREMIAVGNDGEHFCWFHLRSGRNADCVIEVRIPDQQVKETSARLCEVGIEPKDHRLIPTHYSRTIDIPANIDQLNNQKTWSCIERVLAIGATSA